MKPFSRHWFLSCVCITALASQGNSDPAPQPEMEFTQGAQNTFNADWEGVSGRTYFLQLSLDLEMWHYAPFMHFGEGDHQRGIESDSDKFFLRLFYGDFPGINSLDDAMNADFDGDGLSNIFEITHGYDPFDIESTIDGPDASHDPDEDGLGNTSELSTASNPMAKDNHLLQLDIIID
jgi:hypothetical protein